MNRALFAFALLALAASARAAGEALPQAYGAANDGAIFDGAKTRSPRGEVQAGPTADTRSPEQIAADEAARTRSRLQKPSAVTPGPDKEIAKPKSSTPFYQTQDFKEGIKGALIGALIGSFGGIFGALIGAAVGFAIGYVLSKLWG